MNRLVIVVVGLSVLLVPWHSALACSDDRLERSCVYDPQPDAEVMKLPMPGGLAMVFRRVPVAGLSYWSNADRVIRIGDIENKYFAHSTGPYEGTQKVQVAGGFLDAEAGHWYYLMGKYEVSFGQYVAVMGKGDEAEGLKHLFAHCGDKKYLTRLGAAMKAGKEEAKWRLLAQPVRAISFAEVQAFIRRYNLWCFANKSCRSALPMVTNTMEGDGDPESTSFIRLPTEIEWEYAARGGLLALREETEAGGNRFDQSLPFEAAEVDKFAWAAKPSDHARGKAPQRIGFLAPTNGFHDLFGNVQELASSLFTAELTQGRVGALTARGGSFSTKAQTLRASLRTEVPIFAPDRHGQVKEFRSRTTGMRLAIGGQLIVGGELAALARSEYTAYRESDRAETPAGESLKSPLVTEKGFLEGLTDRLKARLGLAEVDRDAVDIELAKVSRRLDAEVDAHTELMVNQMISNLYDFGHQWFLMTEREKGLRLLSKTDAVSVGKKRLLERVRQQIQAHRRHSDRAFREFVAVLKQLAGYSHARVNEKFIAFRAKESARSLYPAFADLAQARFKEASAGILKPDAWRAELREQAHRLFSTELAAKRKT